MRLLTYLFYSVFTHWSIFSFGQHVTRQSESPALSTIGHTQPIEATEFKSTNNPCPNWRIPYSIFMMLSDLKNTIYPTKSSNME